MKYLTGVLIILAMLFCVQGALTAEEETLADFQQGATQLADKCLPGLVAIVAQEINGVSGGSGFIVDREGYVFTNYHVAGSHYIVELRTWDGEAYRAVNVGADNSIDFCLLKIVDPPDNLVPMALADSSRVKVGDLCMCMGSPGGSAGQVDVEDFVIGMLDANSCALGVVNSIDEYSKALQWARLGELTYKPGYGMHLTHVFNLDSEINHGNSGGPTVNAMGEVIGINTYGMDTGNKYFESTNICVPINHHKKAARGIINYGHPRWPYLGIDILPRRFASQITPVAFGSTEVGSPYENINRFIPQTMVNPFESPEIEDIDKGHEITYVSRDSPAWEAGLRPGDWLISFDQKKYKNPFDIARSILMDHEIGDEVVLVIRRDERVFPAVKIVLGEKYILNDQTDNLTGLVLTHWTY